MLYFISFKLFSRLAAKVSSLPSIQTTFQKCDVRTLDCCPGFWGGAPLVKLWNMVDWFAVFSGASLTSRLPTLKPTSLRLACYMFGGYIVRVGLCAGVAPTRRCQWYWPYHWHVAMQLSSTTRSVMSMLRGEIGVPNMQQLLRRRDGTARRAM